MAVISTNLEILEDETTRTGFKVYTRKDIDDIQELQTLSEEQRVDMKAVSAVLPFRVNNYVIQDLIDWNNIPNDPIYQLTFPQPGPTSSWMKTKTAMVVSVLARTYRSSSLVAKWATFRRYRHHHQLRGVIVVDRFDDGHPVALRSHLADRQGVSRR
ncbi:MAG: hypothetical protein E2P02_06430 [Acidobacteria bacterium]|nr:MAG: hypothetical protein E2P02_06430 [Acidobacteriota bacterium]